MGGTANIHLWSVHRPGSMEWLAFLVYVVLVLRLSSVADLCVLPLTPLLRCPLVEVEEHVWDPPESVPAALPAVEELMSKQSSSGHSKSSEIDEFPKRGDYLPVSPLAVPILHYSFVQLARSVAKKHYFQHVSSYLGSLLYPRQHDSAHSFSGLGFRASSCTFLGFRLCYLSTCVGFGVFEKSF